MILIIVILTRKRTTPQRQSRQYSIALDHDTPKKKKAKRLSRFQTKWESDFDWCRRVPGNMFEANCTLCNRNFGIGHGGRNDLTIHSKSDLHKGNVNAARSSSVFSYFVKSTPTGLDKQVSCTHIRTSSLISSQPLAQVT